MDQEPNDIQIDEVLYLRRVVSRLRVENAAATDAVDKLGALVDQLAAENQQLLQDVKKLSGTLAAQGKTVIEHSDDS